MRQKNQYKTGKRLKFFCFAEDFPKILNVIHSHSQGLKIPEELDVFGFDCADICSMLKPPLPVVHQPEQEMGRLAATYLIDRLEGYDGPYRVTELKCRVLPAKHV